jgi:hypothetical protein
MFTREDLHALTAPQRKADRRRFIVRHIANTIVALTVVTVAAQLVEAKISR